MVSTSRLWKITLIIALLLTIDLSMAQQEIVYHRNARHFVAGEELSIRSQITFTITADMLMGVSGMEVRGEIVGYQYVSYGVEPESFCVCVPLIPAEWDSVKYIIRYDKPLGVTMSGNEVILDREKFRIL